MESIFSKLSQFTENAIGRIRLRSALNSTLWLCGVSLLFACAGAYLFDGLIEAVFAAIPCVAMGVFVFQAIWFTVKDPDKLRSEEYELRRHALTLIEEKGGTIAVAESSVEAIAASDYRPLGLPDASGGQ